MQEHPDQPVLITGYPIGARERRIPAIIAFPIPLMAAPAVRIIEDQPFHLTPLPQIILPLIGCFYIRPGFPLFHVSYLRLPELILISFIHPPPDPPLIRFGN